MINSTPLNDGQEEEKLTKRQLTKTGNLLQLIHSRFDIGGVEVYLCSGHEMEQRFLDN